MSEKKQSVFTHSNGVCRLAVRVKPNSQKTRVLGVNTERQALEIALNAQPQDGVANQALVDLLSQLLKIPKDKIKIVSGRTSRDKILQIDCSATELENKLSEHRIKE